MKFTLAWLKEHLDTDASVEALADKLTMIGLEVENLEDKGKLLAPFTIARDLAAADVGKFKDPSIKPVAGAFPCPVTVTLDFGATPSLCRAFALRLVRGVKNGPSPEWLQRRLAAIGLRPINALVDITNFITYDRGRPLHVFDAAKVRSNLTVRRARPGETLTALDGKTYALDDTMCVIADEAGPESLAGIMGGEATGCACAWWTPARASPCRWCAARPTRVPA